LLVIRVAYALYIYHHTIWGIHEVNPEEEKGRAAVFQLINKGNLLFAVIIFYI